VKLRWESGIDTGVFVTALAEAVHSDGAIPPGRKYFLPMAELIMGKWDLGEIRVQVN